MRVNKNIASLNIYKEYSKNIAKQSDALGRISSGIKVSSSKDNPNAIAQSERLRMQIRGLQMASRNTQDSISMIQTTEGGIEGITRNLQRVRELLVQSGGIANMEDKETIKNEINQMLDGADNMANITEINGVKLLVGGENDGSVVIESATGANVGEKIDIPKCKLTKEGLNLDALDFDNIGGSIEKVDEALDVINSFRSKYGALSNRFESNYQFSIEMSDKIQGAESSIRDTDMAEEMIGFAKYNILIEAGNSMMAQTNRFPQDILRVLENVR